MLHVCPRLCLLRARGISGPPLLRAIRSDEF
jgi:hypothetical protein